MLKASYYTEKILCDLKGFEFDERKFWVKHILKNMGFVIIILLILYKGM